MRWPALISVLVGLAVALTLILANNLSAIAAIVAGAGWGLALVVALHLPQILLSAFGWRAVIDAPRLPTWPTLLELRWIRESVNALLPVAQIGGEFVRCRLLAARGVGVRAAVASVTVDLAVELASEMVFALMGLMVLIAEPHKGGSPVWLLAALAGGALIALSFMAAQRWGGFRLVERLLPRLEHATGWAGLGDVTGLHDAVVALYRSPRRVWPCGVGHLASWLFGVVETWAALYVLHIHAGLREAFVIESLGQAVRTMGFAVPGALGVQEGGYILICALFGIDAQQAIALALVRRIREVALGIPGLATWRLVEARRPTSALTAGTP